MKTGIIASCWDLLHPGHVSALRYASERCDHLIAAFHTFPSHKNVLVQLVSERFLQLQACKYVDEIVVYQHEHELETLLIALAPGVRFLGEDYKDRNDFTGSDLDIDIEIIPRGHGWSSSELKHRISKLYI
jgi:glycerol-3-phosphate cytidylyltransferase